MKKYVIAAVVLLLIGYGFTRMEVGEVVKDHQVEVAQAQLQGDTDNTNTLLVTQDDVYKGTLLLINKDHPVPPQAAVGEVVQLEDHPELLQGYSLLDHKIMLSKPIVQTFMTMIEAAGRDGVDGFILTSGYRDHHAQQILYEQMGGDYALPAGYSEHNLGLSIDIGSTHGEMKDAPEGRWLEDHAWRYGYVLRYPEDKTAITGIAYEPWHFRYVGLPHSAIMKEKDMVLEEYIAYLREAKAVTTTMDLRRYTVSYFPVTGDTSIPVPKNGRYELSGDNAGGVILTVYH